MTIILLITIVTIPENRTPFASEEETVTGSQSVTFALENDTSPFPRNYANPDSTAW